MPTRKRASTTTTSSVPNKSPRTVADLFAMLGRLKTMQLVVVLLIVAAFLLGYLVARVQVLEKGGTGTVAQAPAQGAPAAEDPNKVYDVKTGALPAKGKDSAKVTIVEFSDFQCPFCEQFYTQTLPQIQKEYIDTGKVKLYYRHYPLSFHPAANPAALASECANDQGKFWEYHDTVFANQAKISVQGQTEDQINTQLKAWASDLGLTSEFDTCLESKKHQAKIDKDMTEAQTVNVSGTPGFFINGKQLVGAQPFAAFKAAIDAAL